MKITPGFTYVGKISSFGGPLDSGLSTLEGLALFNSMDEAPELFLDNPDPNVGIARNLNPNANFCAMRWSYDVTPKPLLRFSSVMISFKDKYVLARCLDWGPHENTGRLIDVSDNVMKTLGCKTDDVVKAVLKIPKLT